MDDICESGEVPTLSYVVEHIYSSCDTEKNGAVLASALVDFVRPLMSNLPNGISEFLEILDPNNENPAISRTAFFEAMQKWIINIEGTDTLQHFSFRDPDSPRGTNLPFYQSTPKPSIEPTSTKNVTNILNLSNFSPTSFSNCKNTSTVACENLVLEEKVKELEHKYGNAINELSMVKSQLLSSEEQYADLKKDLERTNKRLSLEQQIVVDLQKSIEHNDDIKEDIINTKKENEHLQKMLASSKKENSNLMALIRDLEFEKEQFERKMTEIHGKDNKRKEEITDLQMALSLREEENNALKTIKVELEDKLEEQMSLLKHFTEMSEFMKNENQTLRSVVRKMGLTDLSDISSIRDLPNLSSHGIVPNSPNSPYLNETLKSSTPFKNFYHPSVFQREIFNSPKLIFKLNNPVNSDGLDTPPYIRNINSTNSIENSTLDSTKIFEITNGVKNLSNGIGKIQSHFDNSKNSSLNELEEGVDKEDLNLSNNKDTPSMTSSSGNAVCETFEDLDMSTVSEKHSYKGENLLSELQACKTLDQCNDCFVKEHGEMYEIVKEHESCPKIIDEYKEKIEVLTKNIEIIETERKNLVDDYNKQNESIKYFKDLLDKEKSLNEHLASENFKLTEQIVNFIDIENEKEKQLKELEYKTKEMEGEVAKFKNKEETTSTEYNNLINKFDSLQNEKMFLEKQLMQLNTEKTHLSNEISDLRTKNDILSNKIESKDKKIQELHTVLTEKEHLEEELRNTEFQQIENCNTIENLTKKLEESKNMGHYFVQIIKKKITDQKTKVQFLNELNMKLEEQVNKLKNDLQHMKTEMYLVKSPSALAFNAKLESRENIGNESTSTEGSETSVSTERPQYRKRQNCIKRINYEKQQVKIIKLEEQVELLQKELFNEKSKTQNIYNLEFQVNELKLEKISLEQEKNIILEQLNAIKHDLSLKENMMSQFEKSQKLEFDNLSERFSKENEMISANLIEALKRTEENEKLLRTQIDQLEQEVTTSKEEKLFLESLLSKKETKIITLKKTLSDIMKSSEEAKVFENIVIEKESMLQFSRELLMKSNNSLELSENCICSLNLLLDHCKVVLLETAVDLFSATKEAFEALKNDFNIIPEEFDFISTMKDFHKENSKFTVEIIEEIKCNLILSSKLLRSLARNQEPCAFYVKIMRQLLRVSTNLPLDHLNYSFDVCLVLTPIFRLRV
ncbi:hypothetical protein WA026_000863 [Henosepilachna vigintioctopunctata]|uniref:Uncharacterized protein n=1 Tax=Henosepilachna vigintioctopunctata TaxID=420089 RepID=A0AAW1V9B6_9CUCU